MLKEIYAPLLPGRDARSSSPTSSRAELIKYASNGFLATKISFINEIARLCELLGADVEDVARGMGLDSAHRPASSCIPGPGFGGSCFPKDTARGGRSRAPARLHASRSSRR